MFIITLRWPHEGVVLGYEVFYPTENESYYTFRVHLLLISIAYEWGEDYNPYI